MVHLVWLIPALPLAGFLVLMCAGRRIGEPGAGWLATLCSGGAFVATAIVFVSLWRRPEDDRVFTQTLYQWLPVGGLHVDVGFLVDPLSITMALFITGIGTLIHLYSIGYMHGDPKFSKFFVYLNLFVFSMLMLVLGSNLLVTFLGWEGVGACSYFLIAFWFSKDANASAGKKAFVTNRIGDWGFMLAIFLVFEAVGSLSYTQVLGSAGSIAPVTATAITLLFFVGACGKSAQIPLYVWLPDAMAGPTPVSALIHAATMVTAGVYLMVRINPIIAQGYTWAPTLIACVGAATALVAATIAVAQNDIKKVLAYSTVSQLGYMFLAVGCGGYVAAVFHMITHAFFKALLFLGSGSVIHGMHDEQDMRKMGGLRKFMPITCMTFIVGWMAIAGVPPFAGFWSKDDILLFAYNKSPILWFVGLVTAILTAFYMTRQVIMVFFGEERWREVEATAGGEAEQSAAAAAGEEATAGASHDVAPGATTPAPAHAAAGHGDDHGHGFEPHESAWLMTAPLLVLAGLAVIGGLIDLPFAQDIKFLDKWLEPVVGANEAHITVPTAGIWLLALIAIAGSLTGIACAYGVYVQRRVAPEKIELDVFAHAWYYDETITSVAGGPGYELFEATASVDAQGVDWVVNEAGTLVRSGGGRLRKLQTGYVRNYALGIAAGAIVLVALFLTQAG